MDIKGSKAWDVLGGKTARACESCLVKRARWFCAADDAFLCQPCDASIHSANQLANQHDRVALGTSSTPAAAWFTRKPRTPRINPKNQTLPLVPEINNEDPDSPEEENGEQLLYRVPVFDPLPEGGDQDEGIANMLLDDDEACHGLNLAELLSTCGEELAADVEGLLGSSTGVQEDFAYLRSSYTDHISHYESNRIGESLDAKGVKVEEDDEVQEMIACHYASNSSMTGEETKGAASVKTTSDMDSRSSEYSQVNTRTVSLRLNYEAVMAAWASQGSPWTKGTRPQLDIDEFMAAVSGGGGGVGGASGCKDAGREARVSRYREKRRTRLFSNKIRYQVRKLNAENRPRIKGRFVKRPTISASNSLPYLPLLINKK